MTRSLEIELQPADNLRLANLCGPLNQHLRQIESRMGVEINNRGQNFQLIGEDSAVMAVAEVLKALYLSAESEEITAAGINVFLQDSGVELLVNKAAGDVEQTSVKIAKGLIKGRGLNQIQYLRNIQTHDLSLGIGPAGTGKTYLAVASAV
ncbi:MAG: PhoH family protein, partial [Gammaproteobacteria bacterium]|nr:PhoH family protein [Gammaproteobacteria bacterium]